MPYRSFVGVPFAVWMFAALALRDGSPRLRPISAIATVILVFQTMVLANLYQASHYFASRKDLLLAGTVTDHIFQPA